MNLTMTTRFAHPCGRWLAGCLWLVSPALHAQAHAQAGEVQATAAARETARTLMDEGERLRAAGDLRGALARFKAAHAILPIPTTGLQLARVHAGLGEYVEARGVALEASHHPSSPGEPGVFAQARQRAGQLAAELAPKIPSLQAHVAPADASYQVRVDGSVLPEASRAMPFKCNPGTHEVVVEAEGYLTERRQVQLADGQLQVLELTLQRDGRPTPLQAASAPDVTARAAALTTQPGELQVDDDATRAVRAQRTRAYIGLGAGGAVLLTGIVSGIVSARKTADLKERCPHGHCGPAEREALSSANTFANISNVALPLGLVGVGYGLYELLTLPETVQPERATRGLQLAWSGTYATLRGSL